MYWVYILRCADETLYSGCTTDLKRRIREHNEGRGAKYTRSRVPVMLLQTWKVSNRSQALRLEALIKKCPKHEKETFIFDPSSLLRKADEEGLQFHIELDGERRGKHADRTD